MSADRDQHVDEAIAEYLAGCDADCPPDRAAFLAKYPELADSLREFLDDHARMRLAAGSDSAPALVPVGVADPASGSPVTVRYIGDYELLAEIARGGMGVVFRARQVSLNREVALKMILTGQLANASDVARFRTEAEAAGKLDHPSILPIYEVGEHLGQQYFAMKLVPGGSLSGKVSELVNDPKAAVALFAKVCRAVDFAHRRGILHRDLKPGNILLDAAGTPYVTDFGLAKKVEGDSNLTQSGAIVGTPSYMAPEQARAEKSLTTAADVYALGAILYELLTGQPPFRGASVLDTLLQVQEQEPQHPRTVNPKADRDLSVIALKCLEKDPAKRYESAAALADDLDRWSRGEPVSVSPATRLERVVKWARRKPTLAAAYALTAVAVFLLAFGGVAAWLLRDAVRARDELAATQDKLARVEYGRAVQMAHQEWREDNVSAAVALLEGTPAHLRGWEYWYVHRLCHSDILTLKGHTGQVWSASWSPDGSRIVTGSGDKTAKVWDARTGALIHTLMHDHGVGLPSFSRDGMKIVICTGNTAKVWDANTGAELLTLAGHAQGVGSAELSQDGSRIVTASDDRTAKVWDAKKGTLLHTLKGHKGGVNSASFSADGSRVVTGSYDTTVKVWDATTGAVLLTLDKVDGLFSMNRPSFTRDGLRVVTPRGRVWDARTGAVLTRENTGPVLSELFSPDGSRVLTADDRTASVRDWKTGAEVLALKGHTHTVWSAAFSPDGSRVVTASEGMDGEVKVWDAKGKTDVLTFGVSGIYPSASWNPDGSRIVSGETMSHTAKVLDARTGGEILVLEGHTGFVWSAAYSPDGARIATGSEAGTVKVHDATTGAKVLDLRGHTKEVYSVSFSPEGSRIVTASNDHTAKVWDATTGAEILTFQGHSAGVKSASWSPDGSRIVTASWDGIKVWNATTGAEVLVLWDGDAGAAAFSPDGSRVAGGDSWGPVRVWDARTGVEVLTLRGHTSFVGSMSWSPDGSRIATGSYDRTAKVWDAKSGAEVLTLKGHTESVARVSWSPDGSRIVTAQHEWMKIWDATPLNREFLPK